MYGSEDDLVDYNDSEFDTKVEPHSHSPVQTPQALDSENEGDDEVKRVKEAKSDATQRDLEEGLRAEEAKNIREHEERKAKRIQEFHTLNQKLSENGYKM